MKGSEQVKNVEREKETLTSHKSATAGSTGKVKGLTPQPNHNLLYQYYGRASLEIFIIGLITRKLKIF